MEDKNGRPYFKTSGLLPYNSFIDIPNVILSCAVNKAIPPAIQYPSLILSPTKRYPNTHLSPVKNPEILSVMFLSHSPRSS